MAAPQSVKIPMLARSLIPLFIKASLVGQFFSVLEVFVYLGAQRLKPELPLMVLNKTKGLSREKGVGLSDVFLTLG